MVGGDGRRKKMNEVRAESAIMQREVNEALIKTCWGGKHRSRLMCAGVIEEWELSDPGGYKDFAFIPVFMWLSLGSEKGRQRATEQRPGAAWHS